MIKIKSLLT